MKNIVISILLIAAVLFSSCVSSSVEEFHPEDYGVFDVPEDLKVYKSTSDGMIDSTGYYATSSYNSFTKMTTTNVNKTGWARMTTKTNIQNDCLKNSCRKSSVLGYEYILIFDKLEDVYESGHDIRYSCQIFFIPLNKEDITPDLQEYTIYQNSLYYQPTGQRNTAYSSKSRSNYKKNDNGAAAVKASDIVSEYGNNTFVVNFAHNNSSIEYVAFLSKTDVASFEGSLLNSGYEKKTTYFNNTNLSKAVVEGMQHFNAIGCAGEANKNTSDCYVVLNYIENGVYNTSIFTKQ